MKNEIVIVITTLIVFNVILLTGGYSYLKSKYLMSNGNGNRDRDSYKGQKFTQSFAAVTRTNSSPKVVLLWNLPKSVSYPKQLDPIRCGKCVIITDRNMQNESDAVVFSFRGMSRPSDFPSRPKRKPDQVYVWLCRESPKTTKDVYKLDLSRINNIINWTMTYRLDSDVFFPYSEILHRIHDEKLSAVDTAQSLPAFINMYYASVDELMSRKRYMTAWVVGNCDKTKGARARMELVQNLMKAGLSIQRFGRCFKETEFPPYRSEEAHERLMEFKFYLAFENTFNCRDYVTYKFWKNAIYSGAVPIVWGASKADLVRMAPKHSFIHMEDFESMMHLVYYLKYLDSNDTAHREYFRWREKEIEINQRKEIQDSTILDQDKTDLIFSTNEAFGYCELCRMLQAENNYATNNKFKRKTIASMNDWWYGSEKKDCFA